MTPADHGLLGDNAATPKHVSADPAPGFHSRVQLLRSVTSRPANLVLRKNTKQDINTSSALTPESAQARGHPQLVKDPDGADDIGVAVCTAPKETHT